jgi:CheY-like chemotaxis protein
MMPVMDGEGFRKKQLEDPRLAHIPVIIVSAYRDLERSAELLKAAHFIKKPPRLDELKSAVAQHC